MSRISSTFAALRKENKTALIPFITAGDPVPDITAQLMHSMVGSGADIIELGVPFSEPMADGPVIQQASDRALKHGVSLTDVMNMVAEFRQGDSTTPVVLMGYMNPLEVMGYQEFADSASQCGVDGILLVDLPPEESAELKPHLDKNELDQIFLLSPTTSLDRVKKIGGHGSGFLYYVALKGVTGSNKLDINDVTSKLGKIKNMTDLPLAVGFGIKDPETAASVAKIADAVVIGSALVDRIAGMGENREHILSEAAIFISTLRQAIDQNN